MNEALTFDDVTLAPNYNPFLSRREVDISVELGPYKFAHGFVVANMDSLVDLEMAKAIRLNGGLCILHRYCSVEDNVKLFTSFQFDSSSNKEVAVSVGVREKEIERVAALYEVGARLFCVETAHAHSKITGQMIKRIKKDFPSVFVVAGNVCTYAGGDYLASCGADCVKVGIGPGSSCQTRIMSSNGIPQLTAVHDCGKLSVPIISDGGIKYPKDACLAFAAGARMVMLGGYFSKCREAAGKIIERDDKQYRVFRGMASKEANEDLFGEMSDWKTAEGISMEVEVNGTYNDRLKELAGGLRSCLTYQGAHNIQELSRKARFVRITHAGFLESMPHGKGRL